MAQLGDTLFFMRVVRGANHTIGPAIVRELIGVLAGYPSGSRGMVEISMVPSEKNIRNRRCYDVLRDLSRNLVCTNADQVEMLQLQQENANFWASRIPVLHRGPWWIGGFVGLLPTKDDSLVTLSHAGASLKGLIRALCA